MQDVPALCLEEFPADRWDAILRDPLPLRVLTSLLDKLDAGYPQTPEKLRARKIY